MSRPYTNRLWDNFCNSDTGQGEIGTLQTKAKLGQAIRSMTTTANTPPTSMPNQGVRLNSLNNSILV